MVRLGFKERVKGSHRIFTRDGIDEIINIQSKGSIAKPYQVKQVRFLITKYKMEII
jgi:predicted RNA binding protein YcfA (HicA-like mRNA interferase family)